MDEEQKNDKNLYGEGKILIRNDMSRKRQSYEVTVVDSGLTIKTGI